MKNRLAFIIFALSIFFLPLIASADIAPSPSVDFRVTLNKQAVPDSAFDANLLTCQKPEEKTIQPAENLNTQLKNINEYNSQDACYWRPLTFGHSFCSDGNCDFTGGLSPIPASPFLLRLAIYLPSQDKVYLSSPFTLENMQNNFDADLLPDGSIQLQETNNFFDSQHWEIIKSILPALGFTLLIEVIAALIFLSSTKTSLKILLSVVIANVISLPVLWYALTFLRANLLNVIIGEILVFVFEGFFIYLLNKKRVSLKKSFVLSMIMNLASLLIGLAIITGLFWLL